MTRKKVLVVADVTGWAWDKKARALKQHLDGDEFQVDVAYMQHDRLPEGYDLYHLFEVYQVNAQPLPHGARFVTGITAHVWRTWEMRHGAGTVRGWAAGAVAVHANSVMLRDEFSAHLGRPVYYLPNGVDEAFYQRYRPRSQDEHLVVGHVGKPNPRKGCEEFIRPACAAAGVELREIRRTSKDAFSAEQMREFYQDLHALVVASDMDGTPNPAFEAAACEIAIVSNPIGNMPEFLAAGEGGVLVERSVDAYVSALCSLKQNMIGCIERGREARRVVERDWTWAKMAQNYARMWREVIA